MKNMKTRILFLIVAFLLSLQVVGQQEVIYGTVRSDGYQKITKGAFWSSRPEAKLVYEGSTPPGVEVYTLESDYFVRFIDTEHNQLDRNYIIFPKGEKVYVKNGQFYSAKCGNKIEYIRSVDLVKIVEKVIEKEKINLSDNFNKTASLTLPTDNGGETKGIVPPQNYQPQQKEKKQKTWVGRNLIWLIPAAAVLVGVGLYIFHKKPEVPHGTMSNGRPFDLDAGTGAGTGTGNGTGGRGN